jgi:uncharacterized protein (DUF2141 family)
MNLKQLSILLFLATAVFLLAGCGSNEPEATAVPPTAAPTEEIPPTVTPEPSATPLTEPVFGLATVESMQILTQESFPVQIDVRVRGVLPDGCTQIDDIITQSDGANFDVAVTTVREPDAACTQGEVSFEEVVPLEVLGLDAGTYTVSVNGIQGSFTLDADNRLPEESETTPAGETAPAGEAAAITGTIWHDLCTPPTTEEGDPSDGCLATPDGGFQANGLPEAGEPGIGGLTVSLGAGACPSDGLAVAETAADGTYSFTDLAAGEYCVSVDTLGEGNQELLIPGSWTFPESGIPETAVTLAAGETAADVNFGWDYELAP